MGLDYNVYRPKNKLQLKDELELIEETYRNSIKSKYTSYCIEFNLKEIDKFFKIKERWTIKNDNLYLANHDSIYNVQDIIHIIKRKDVFQWLRVYSKEYSDDSTLGFDLKIDTEENDLVFLINLPYKNLEQSKAALYDLLIKLKKNGIYLGINEYGESKKKLDQFIDLNSSTNSSETWQLNLSQHSFSHANHYVPNSNYKDKNLSKYRLAAVKVGYPKYHFKHNDINEYCAKLLEALSACFEDLKINLMFKSSNSELVNVVEDLKKGKFNLFAEISLEGHKTNVTTSDLDDLFEIKHNRLMAEYLKLDENHNFFVNFSIEQVEKKDSEFKIYITHTHDEELEKHFKSEVEKKLNIELEYIGAE